MVGASGLIKRFEETCAVDGVSLSVAAGEVRGLLGPNGAGKTTLLRMLFGLVRPDAGVIELCGRRLDEHGRLTFAEVAGFVEDPGFYPYLSGRANLEVLARIDGEAAWERIDDALERVELSARAGDRVGGYSSGMRQRLGIAAALLRAPRLLMLDEPTSALDPGGARLVLALLRALADTGVAVLLSSHRIGEVEATCDSFTVLSRGRVVWDGTAEQMHAQAPPSAYLMATSDDDLALALARGRRGLAVARAPSDGLAVQALDDALDSFVVALGRADVAVRRLELSLAPLESMFFALTGQAEDDSFRHPPAPNGPAAIGGSGAGSGR